MTVNPEREESGRYIGVGRGGGVKLGEKRVAEKSDKLGAKNLNKGR